jgi:hypothetical protein
MESHIAIWCTGSRIVFGSCSVRTSAGKLPALIELPVFPQSHQENAGIVYWFRHYFHIFIVNSSPIYLIIRLRIYLVTVTASWINQRERSHVSHKLFFCFYYILTFTHLLLIVNMKFHFRHIYKLLSVCKIFLPSFLRMQLVFYGQQIGFCPVP